MDETELEHQALRVGRQANGAYRGKTFCQVCLMDKACIAAPEDRRLFEDVWFRWTMKLKRDRCVVCGEQKEALTLPLIEERGKPGRVLDIDLLWAGLRHDHRPPGEHRSHWRGT